MKLSLGPHGPRQQKFSATYFLLACPQLPLFFPPTPWDMLKLQHYDRSLIWLFHTTTDNDDP